MKTRNIIQHTEDGTPNYSSRFEVYQHIILRNGWEYYLEEEDSDGIAYGFVMGFANEWGAVDMAEIKPYVVSVAKGSTLQEVLPPDGYAWEGGVV